MSPALSTFILVLHTLLAAGLVAVILMQRSEGGALGIGGGPGGLMTARGAGNLLTKATAWLAAAFIGTSLFLAILASQGRDVSAIDTSLADDPAAAAPALADDVSGDDPTDPALVTPTEDLEDVPFGFPGAGSDDAASEDDVPLAE
ncbi:preprotein translocase subunit SecG [Pacificimonas flava]|uniref:Protein-export membrane protein SecG n=2 Tax=Pacificimonas TaxID=1960290 RepID=A0A219B763_9SPHN|nr:MULTISPECIES: preprotein translocase subunit SecG [Pacificimonas]MBZ6378613.1 preprotein translocase subunit SecG [Pacificimonas aurantium]OWV34111.1 preprotein translocase subunit SecG [Pacificimonas flava]